MSDNLDPEAAAVIEKSLSKTPTSFRSLPLELRLQIYEDYDLSIQAENNAPALLLALCKAEPELYAELLVIYKALNLVVRQEKQEDFRRLRLKKLLEFKYVRFVWKKHVACDAEMRFRLESHKCLLLNNFERVTFVFADKGLDDPLSGTWAIHYLNGASKPGLKTLNVEFADKQAWNEGRRVRKCATIDLGNLGISASDTYQLNNEINRLIGNKPNASLPE